jgi:hypothetical protein
MPKTENIHQAGTSVDTIDDDVTADDQLWALGKPGSRGFLAGWLSSE